MKKAAERHCSAAEAIENQVKRMMVTLSAVAIK